MVHGHERIDNEPCIMLTGLEDVQKEVVATVISVIGRIHVVPLLVVDRNLHFGRIALIKAIATAIVFAPVEVLRVVDVGIVLETREVATTLVVPPGLTVGLLLLGLSGCRTYGK